MPSSLRKLFEALKTIPPSSIESERTFSVTGFYITKFRCSLGDQSINALVFLKHIRTVALQFLELKWCSTSFDEFTS